MEDEATIELYRTAEHDWKSSRQLIIGRNIKLIQQIFQGEIDRPVHHQAQCALVTMLANIGQRLREEGICHGGHGNEEMMGQVDTLHEVNDYAVTISWDVFRSGLAAACPF